MYTLVYSSLSSWLLQQQKKIINFDIKRKWTNERKKKCFRHIARLEFKIKSISTTLVSLYFILAAFSVEYRAGQRNTMKKNPFYLKIEGKINNSGHFWVNKNILVHFTRRFYLVCFKFCGFKIGAFSISLLLLFAFSTRLYVPDRIIHVCVKLCCVVEKWENIFSDV